MKDEGKVSKPRWDGAMKNEGEVVIVAAFSSLMLVDSPVISV